MNYAARSQEVMKQLGAEHVMVVHSKDGLDEIGLASSTCVARTQEGEITEWELTPERKRGD